MAKKLKLNMNYLGSLLGFIVIIVAVYFLLKYLGVIEPLENVEGEEEQQMEEQPQELAQGTLAEEQPTAEVDNLAESRPQLVADDLLPKYDEANEFAEQNPVSKLLKEQNFLISGYHVGTNTVMQSTKIPYHDIRSAPPIPREAVGPWSQSSYDTFSGAMQRKLE